MSPPQYSSKAEKKNNGKNKTEMNTTFQIVIIVLATRQCAALPSDNVSSTFKSDI